jgi:hypothetical protein
MIFLILTWLIFFSKNNKILLMFSLQLRCDYTGTNAYENTKLESYLGAFILVLMHMKILNWRIIYLGAIVLVLMYMIHSYSIHTCHFVQGTK